MIKWLKGIIGQRNPIRLVWHQGKAMLAAFQSGFPAKKLTVIGITGTDGKTTTVSMVQHILSRSGIPCAAASTAFMQIGNERRENASHLTSIDPFTLQKFLRRCVDAGCTHVVIEMSSHGLVQGRTRYTFPKIAAITNTALEHLDYHGTMDQYRKDKGKIFEMLRRRGTKVLNGTDESYALYSKIPSERTIVYGTESSDLWVSDVQSDAVSSSAHLYVRNGRFPLHLPIPGIFNLENALCAIGCALALSIPAGNAAKALHDFKGVPGRMEKIDEGQDFSVFVDFAVSPQAYEKALKTLREIVGENGKVRVLCSSCGNRMREKRPEIGRICSELADVLVATEDETYGEDPHAVLKEVWAGVDQSSCEAYKIFDRYEAIEFLLKSAQKGDAVILCGMGPFSTMTKLEGRIPWDEREVAREILRKLQ